MVLSTLPTPEVTSTVARLHAMFPSIEREIGRIRLSEVLRGVVSQRLLPRKDEGARIPAVEVLVTNSEVRALLRDPERVGGLRGLMAEGQAEGMQTMDQHVARLLEAGLIAPETSAALSV
jgi:twitching motility protein PilT